MVATTQVTETAETAETTASPILRFALWSGLAIVLIGIVAAAAWSWSGGADDPPGPPLLIGPTVPEFSLIGADGRTITKSDLSGRVWLADFVFTRCSGPCPTLSARMQSLQSALADHPEVKLVTFTLDPKNDTPSVMADYAKRFHADPNRWWFLTGDDEAAMHNLVEKGLKQTVIPAKDDRPIIHSVYIIVIDKA
ncbi:MAG: SCO family protein, partial [Planctomycetota bacterium]